MGKWTCSCGYPMNNHLAPDPNGFSVYSDLLWEEMMEKLDDDNRISYYDISEASFYMWRCPNCKSLMIIGDDDRPNSFTYYHRTPVRMPQDKHSLRIAAVNLADGNTAYYVCDTSIDEDDVIEVPTDEKGKNARVIVSYVFYASKSHLPCPIEELKRAIRKCSDFDEESAKAVANQLLASHKVLDLSEETASIPKMADFDILKTPLGHFWLELNGVPVPMKVVGLTNDSFEKDERIDDEDEDKFVVAHALSIQPSNKKIRTFMSLKLCSDFDVDSSCWYDGVFSDIYTGSTWDREGWQFGITMRESSEYNDECGADRYSRVPYYKKWHKDCVEQYEFRLAWKKYEWEADWSVNFYITSEKIK